MTESTDGEVDEAGLVLEATRQLQQQAAAAVARLEALPGRLGEDVQRAVSAAFVAEMRELHLEVKAAETTLRRLRRGALRGPLLGSLAGALVAGLGVWVVSTAFVPSGAELVRLRATVAALEARGGAVDLVRCGEHRGRPAYCARPALDKARYGANGDYQRLLRRGE